MIAAGRLDQKVQLQEMSGGVDEIGQPLPDVWATVGEYFAAVEPLQGKEYIAAGAMVNAVEARIRMRYRPGVTPAMRVLHGVDTYNIQSVIHVKSAKRELQLMVRAVT